MQTSVDPVAASAIRMISAFRRTLRTLVNWRKKSLARLKPSHGKFLALPALNGFLGHGRWGMTLILYALREGKCRDGWLCFLQQTPIMLLTIVVDFTPRNVRIDSLGLAQHWRS